MGFGDGARRSDRQITASLNDSIPVSQWYACRAFMHYFGRFQDAMLVVDPPFEGHGGGSTRASLVNHTLGSVHTGLSICELAPGGTLDPHVHSFEEGFYVLAGEAVVSINDQAYQLKAGDYGVAKVG